MWYFVGFGVLLEYNGYYIDFYGVFFFSKKIILHIRITKISITDKYTWTSKMTPLELPKWLKCTTKVQNIPKPKKIIKTPPKKRQQPRELLKWSKDNWNLKNKQNTLESYENYQNTPKLNQNILDSIDFEGIFVGFKLFCLFQRILGHFSHFRNVEGYFFNHFRYLRHFDYLRGIQIILLILAISRVFWSFFRFSSYFSRLRAFKVIFMN